MTPALDTPETRVVAHLPGLDIEMVHRAPAGDAGEAVGVMLRAVPSFDAFAANPLLANPFAALPLAANPFLIWAQLVQATWSAWAGALAPVAQTRKSANTP
jgi:hypothetical protein